MLFVYPIGIPLMNLFLLFKHRDRINPDPVKRLMEVRVRVRVRAPACVRARA